MYETFYGLTLKPFQISPDAEFYFDAAPHRRAMAYLLYGMDRKEGFIVLTGESGTGKTTLVNRVLAGLGDSRIASVMQGSSGFGVQEMLRAIAAAFGNAVEAGGIAEALLAVEIGLASIAGQGNRSLLVVDDAHTLSAGALEALRMASNLQLGRHALLQVLLAGEPRLRNAMRDAGLRQRIVCAGHIEALDAAETRRYVGHRLNCAGLQGGLEIHDDAHEVIHAATSGVARRVNALCDRVLLSGLLEERRVFGAADVHRVAAEYEAELAGPPDAPGAEA